MTYKEVILAIRGYENWQVREWERARFVGHQIHMSYPTKEPKKPIHRFLPLPNDLKNRVVKSKEEIEAQRKFFIDKQRKENELKQGKNEN